MFEKEIKFITDYSVEKIKSLGSYFTFEDILSIDIHPSITQYISAELSYLIYEDREKLLSSSIFDYSQPNVVKILKNVDNELKKFKAISFEDIKQLILQAVSFNANFIVRPRWSLLKLVYNEAESKNSEEVLIMLDYIYYHDYLRNIITEYVEKKKLKEISRIEFEEIITKIDNAIIKNNLESYINNSLATILDFFSIGNKNKIKISTDFVEIFLKEKELLDNLLRFKKSFTFGAGIQAGTDEIKKVIFNENIKVDVPDLDEKVEAEDDFFETKDDNIETEDEINEDEDLETEKEAEDKILLDEPEPAINETEIIEDEKLKEINESTNKDENQLKDISNIENDDELLTLFDEELKALAKDNELNSEIDFTMDEELIEKDDIESEKENPEAIKDEKVEENNFIEGIPDKSITKEETETLETEDISTDETTDAEEEIIETKTHREKEIFQYLSDKEIENIVSNVFNEDHEDFATTMEKVSECNTLDEANEIIKGLFISYRVNMYTKDASTLTTAIANYFNQ